MNREGCHPRGPESAACHVGPQAKRGLQDRRRAGRAYITGKRPRLTMAAEVMVI